MRSVTFHAALASTDAAFINTPSRHLDCVGRRDGGGAHVPVAKCTRNGMKRLIHIEPRWKMVTPPTSELRIVIIGMSLVHETTAYSAGA